MDVITLDAVTPVVCDQALTAQLLDFHQLVDALAQAVPEYAQGRIVSPERMVVPLGRGGVMLSMPAAAPDIGIHKLVSVQPANTRLKLPTIHGTVTACDAETGRPLCMLDGPEVTGRRTAAVTLLGMRTLLPAGVRNVLLYGTGVQARYHVQALHAMYPDCRIWVRGRDQESAEGFCQAMVGVHPNMQPCGAAIPEEIDTVVMVTTSTVPVYDEPALQGRLVIGVGAFKPDMAEIGPQTLAGSDIYTDDLAGARHEAGDLLQAGVDWSRVRPLSAALAGQVDHGRPLVFKSVGTAAWDLAAGRVALRALSLRH